MNQNATEVANRALDMIQQLADKMGVTVEKLWGSCVVQARVDGIATSIAFGLLVFALIFSAFALLVGSLKTQDSIWEDERTVPWVVIVIILSIFTLGSAYPCLREIATCFCNP